MHNLKVVTSVGKITMKMRYPTSLLDLSIQELLRAQRHTPRSAAVNHKTNYTGFGFARNKGGPITNTI